MAPRDRHHLNPVEQQAVHVIREIRGQVLSGELPSELRKPSRLAHYLIVLYHGHPKLRVSRLAPQLGVTIRTLERAFRKEFQTNMKAFQIETRLKFAQYLLASNAEAKMSVVAKQLGYDDPNVFARFFQEQAGNSPFAWGKAEQGRRADQADTEGR